MAELLPDTDILRTAPAMLEPSRPMLTRHQADAGLVVRLGPYHRLPRQELLAYFDAGGISTDPPEPDLGM